MSKLKNRVALMSAVWMSAVLGTLAMGAEAADRGAGGSGAMPPPIDRGLDAPVRVGEEGYRLSISPYASHAFDADLKDTSGSTQVTRVGTDAAVSMSMNSSLSLTLGLKAEYSNYYASGLIPGLGGSQKLDMLTIGVTPGFDYKFSEQWSIFAGVGIGVSGETDADAGDALTYGGFVGVRYVVNDDLQLTIGAGASSSFEDDVKFIPIIGGSWRITKGLSLVAAGPSIRLIQELSNGFTVAVGAGYESREYRLGDDAIVPGGALSDTRVPVGVELGWRPNASTYLRATTGAIVYQKYDLDNSSEVELGESESDITPFLALTATFRF